MRIREVTRKAEELIREGEQVNRQRDAFQQQVMVARTQAAAAQIMLDRASQTDDEGNYIGDVAGARARVMVANSLLSDANTNLAAIEERIRQITSEKKETVRILEQYSTNEEANLEKVIALQSKQFATNANSFLLDLVSRMNASEAAKLRLLESMGETGVQRRYSATAGTIDKSNNSPGFESVQSQNQLPATYPATNENDSIHSYSQASADRKNDNPQIDKNNRLCISKQQLIMYRSILRQLQKANLVDLRARITQKQAEEMLMSDFTARSNGRFRTPDEIAADMHRSIKENFMNGFDPDKWKSVDPPKRYKERLELYRLGLSEYIGAEAAEDLSIWQLEEIARAQSAATYRGQSLSKEELIKVCNDVYSKKEGNNGDSDVGLLSAEDETITVSESNADVIDYINAPYTEVAENGEVVNKQYKIPVIYDSYEPIIPSNSIRDFSRDSESAAIWAQEHYGDWRDSLRLSTAEATKQYSGLAYQDINAAKRGLKPMTKEIAKQDAAIHRGLADASLPEDVIVYRGIDESAIKQMVLQGGGVLQSGINIFDDGYLSTSLTAKTHFTKFNKYILKVRAPAGVHAAPLIEGDLALCGGESELLFDGGHNIYITRVSKVPRNTVSGGDRTDPVVLIEGVVSI